MRPLFSLCQLVVSLIFAKISTTVFTWVPYKVSHITHTACSILDHKIIWFVKTMPEWQTQRTAHECEGAAHAKMPAGRYSWETCPAWKGDWCRLLDTLRVVIISFLQICPNSSGKFAEMKRQRRAVYRVSGASRLLRKIIPSRVIGRQADKNSDTSMWLQMLPLLCASAVVWAGFENWFCTDWWLLVLCQCKTITQNHL